MVSRADARRIAEEHAGRPVARVVTVEELDVRPPSIYGAPPLAECWLAYLEQPMTGPRSSEVVLVDRQTGAVRYSGSAHDEG